MNDIYNHTEKKSQKPDLCERRQTQRSIYSMMPFKMKLRGFPGGAVVESLPANAGDTGSSPGLGRSHMPRSN